MISKLSYIVILISFLVGLVIMPQSALAIKCKTPNCDICKCPDLIEGCQNYCVCVSTDETGKTDKPETTIGHITNEFGKHRGWMVNLFFKDSRPKDKPGLLAAMQLMADQFTINGMHQVQAIGSFFDAKHLLETQRLFQKLTARAHKDYQPSQGLCEIGTITRSLASSARNTDLTAVALSRRSVDRQLLAKDTIGTKADESDQESRLVQYIKKYCAKTDNAKNLNYLCKESENKIELHNKDINYTNTLDSALTLDFDFSNQETTVEQSEDENAFYALSANLFANNLFPFVSANKFVNEKQEPNTQGAEKDYLDARALIAKRSVASNSLASIAALKSKGDKESQPFIYAVIKEMSPDEGENILSEEDIKNFIGEQPSYFAQMEVLTKKLYQNPNFYADLYDKPANVLRKDVALQAATLMQKRDLYRSYLRSEMILAVMLEAALKTEQDRVTNEVNKVKRQAATP